MNIIMRDDTEYGVEYVRADKVQDYLNKAIAAERNKLATWMMEKGYATGHGDTIEDLLTELEWQVREREREACAKLVEHHGLACGGLAWGEGGYLLFRAAARIRAKENK